MTSCSVAQEAIQCWEDLEMTLCTAETTTIPCTEALERTHSMEMQAMIPFRVVKAGIPSSEEPAATQFTPRTEVMSSGSETAMAA